jgi:hypothetical protein
VTALGSYLTVLVGPSVPVPAPLALIEALESAEVTHSDEGRSGFQLTFRVGRTNEPTDLLDYSLLSLPLLKPFSRVVLVVTAGALPRVLMDGVITHQQLAPSDEPGGSRLTVTGEDVSVMMDLEEKSAEHPGQDETVIALVILARYGRYGLIPTVIPPAAVDVPLPIERVPVQQATDLAYLRAMAERHGYVFYLKPGPVPLMNTAYWGPPVRRGLPQRALSVNMGPGSNVTSLQFALDGLAPTLVAGFVQDRVTNQRIPVRTVTSLRVPPLACQPAIMAQQPHVRTTMLRDGGLSAAQALARAQAHTDASTDRVVTAVGELDTGRYGDVLWARELVGVRGAGHTYDGLYYVQQVTHRLRKNSYTQSFTLTRDGTGATTPMVRA